jgi:hypothetical protein
MDMLPDDDQDAMTRTPEAQRFLLESHLRYHHRCLREDATNPELRALERLMLVRDRAKRIRKNREAPQAAEQASAENLLVIRRPALAARYTQTARGGSAPQHPVAYLPILVGLLPLTGRSPVR